jgi:rhodanese-related sulfurtransferase
VALTRHWHLRSALRPSELRVEPDHARALVAGGATLVDVRRQEDPSPMLGDAIRVPPDEIPGWIEGMRADVAIVLACT